MKSDKSEILNHYRNKLRQHCQAGKMPGAALISVGPDGIRSATIAGYSDLDNQSRLTDKSIFWMASTGKTVTAMAFMMLVDERKAALDEPVSAYLPYMKTLYKKKSKSDDATEIVPLETPVTIRHLLSHTSGLEFLPGFFQTQELSYISLETQSHVYAASPFQFEPGIGFCYSNAGINIVGRVIEVISGMPYDQFVNKSIFEPLGMNDTGYQLDAEQMSRLVMGYSYDDSEKAWIKHPVVGQMSLLAYNDPRRHAECGGGLFSTPSDMAKLAQMISNHGDYNGKKIITLASLREICKRQTAETIENAYGLGSAVGTVGHAGAWGTDMMVDLDDQQGYIWFVQKAGDWPEYFDLKTIICGQE